MSSRSTRDKRPPKNNPKSSTLLQGTRVRYAKEMDWDHIDYLTRKSYSVPVLDHDYTVRMAVEKDGVLMLLLMELQNPPLCEYSEVELGFPASCFKVMKGNPGAPGGTTGPVHSEWIGIRESNELLKSFGIIE